MCAAAAGASYVRTANVESSRTESRPSRADHAYHRPVTDVLSPMTRLAGWGANVRSDCIYREPEPPRQVKAMLDRAGTVARGLGRRVGLVPR